MYTLYIKPMGDESLGHYTTSKQVHKGDSGVDVYFTERVCVPSTQLSAYGKSYMQSLNIRAAMFNRDGHRSTFLLCPRSSIAKTPIRMANSHGIIDAEYNGELIVALDNVSDSEYTILPGTSLFQICARTYEPFNVVIDPQFDFQATSRGEGGFGSTNTNNNNNEFSKICHFTK